MKKIPEVTLLFGVAFVLTRPFGATFGNLLTKSPEKHGLGFGTSGSSLILLGLLVALVLYDTVKQRSAVWVDGNSSAGSHY